MSRAIDESEQSVISRSVGRSVGRSVSRAVGRSSELRSYLTCRQLLKSHQSRRVDASKDWPLADLLAGSKLDWYEEKRLGEITLLLDQ
jgi:hypothetical protein